MSDYDTKVAAYREAITDAVRYGIGYAIETIETYAVRNPPAATVCAELVATLRAHSAAITVKPL